MNQTLIKMDCNRSFSEDLIPRNAPCPTETSPAELHPLVPEVSLILTGNSRTYSTYPEPKKTFNSWHLNNQNPTFKKSQPIKKHVRFIEPQNSALPVFKNLTTCNSDSPILCRDLELSVFEPPVRNFQTIQPLRYSQINSYQPVIRQIVPEPVPAPIIQRIEPVKEIRQEIVERREYEPTVRDLFDLIQKQNSQLVSLQKQVENLLSMKDLPEQQKAIEAAPPPPPEPIIPFTPEPVHQPQQKMSIGVMTSFEFTIGSRNIETQTSVFNQIEDEDNFEETDDDSENPVQMGWTLYKNAMEHVENILQKSSPIQDCSKKNKENWTMQSIEHLRHLDMNFGDCNISASQRFTFGQSATPISNERSFAMNNLAMKYLPGEKLNEIVNRNQKAKPANTDLSISTYKYMEKYGLLDENRSSNILDKKTIKNMPKLF